MMADEESLEMLNAEKYGLRLNTLGQLVTNKLVTSPFNLEYPIPSFIGAQEAAQKLADLEEFKNAKVIYVSHKSQEYVRTLALEANKEIVLPIHRYRSSQFRHIKNNPNTATEYTKSLSTMHDLKNHSKVFDMSSGIKIDLLVFGSVCVSDKGYRIGEGIGLADLEYAILKHMGAITEETPVVTLVHDSQIRKDLDSELFKEHDVPVDIIVTPTQVIRINPKLKKPQGIIWNLLTKAKVNTTQILQQLRKSDKKNSIDVTLKLVKEHSKGERKSKVSRKRQVRTSHGNDSTQTNTDAVDNNEKSTAPNSRHPRSSPKKQIDFSLKLSNIEASVAKRDLKIALHKRGVKPNDIIWRSPKRNRGICYLHFSKLKNQNAAPDEPIQVDSIMAKLQQFHIGKPPENENDFIIVEPANPISRIEVTDVTSI